MRRWREKRFQNRPFGIGQITWQSQVPRAHDAREWY